MAKTQLVELRHALSRISGGNNNIDEGIDNRQLFFGLSVAAVVTCAGCATPCIVYIACTSPAFG